MAVISIVDYIHELKEAGFTDRQAEVQAKRLEQIVENIKLEVKAEIKQELDAKDPVTKGDIYEIKKEIKELEVKLEVKIEQYRYETLKFTVWTGVAVITALGGMLAKGFHWF